MNPIVNNKQGIIESDINSNNTDIGSNKTNEQYDFSVSQKNDKF